jgi:benzylsuccinate CoA-transferase BbsF subunit
MRIDLSMYETGVSCIAPAVLEAQRGMTRPRLGTAHLWKAPHNVYPCRGADRWITISVANDVEWQRLRQAMAEPAWAMAPCFDTVGGRWQHRQELDAGIAQWTAQYNDQELTHLLQQHGVAAGAVLTAQDLVTNLHLRQRQYFDVFTNEQAPRVGPRVYAGRPFRCSAMPVRLHLVSALGQHNLQVLREVAELSDADIQRLIDAEIIAAQPRDMTKPPSGATGPRAGERDGRRDPHYKDVVRRLIEDMQRIQTGK